jgi:hypothetical protein
MPDSFEIFINEHRADLACFRIILQTFLVRILVANPATAEERLQDLKSTVMGAVERIQDEPGDQGSQRMRHMTAMRAEKFLLELEEVISEAQRIWEQRGKN